MDKNKTIDENIKIRERWNNLIGTDVRYHFGEWVFNTEPNLKDSQYFVIEDIEKREILGGVLFVVKNDHIFIDKIYSTTKGYGTKLLDIVIAISRTMYNNLPILLKVYNDNVLGFYLKNYFKIKDVRNDYKLMEYFKDSK